MKPFEINRRVFTWFCICPNENKKNYLFTTIVIAFFLIGFFISFIFVLNTFAIDLEEAFYGIFQLFAIIDVLYFLFCAIALRHKIARIFPMFQRIYDERTYV